MIGREILVEKKWGKSTMDKEEITSKRKDNFAWE